MDRGVMVGGGLIAASFLVAVLLNRSAREEAAPAKPAPEPPALICDDSARVPPIPGQAPDRAAEECGEFQVKPLQQ